MWFEGVRGLDGRVRSSMDEYTAFRKPIPCFLPTRFHGNTHEDPVLTPRHERTTEGRGCWFESVNGLDGRFRAPMDGFTASRKPIPAPLP